jgi:hypothetical protein
MLGTYSSLACLQQRTLKSRALLTGSLCMCFPRCRQANPLVFFDLAVDSTPLGRVVMELKVCACVGG